MNIEVLVQCIWKMRFVELQIRRIRDIYIITKLQNKYSEILHSQEKCDMIILLSHLGYSADQNVIPQTRYVDLVIGGHSHTFVDDFIYVNDLDGKSVPIITDGCWGEQIGVIKVW